MVAEQVDQVTAKVIDLTDVAVNPTEAICRTIRFADAAVTACHAAYPYGHRARAAMDAAIVALHDARRYTELSA